MLFGNGSGNENVLSTQRATNLQAESRPNQSLKLTEGAVDNFARAKLGVTIGRDIPRADWLRSAAARRRSLAPVR